MWIRTNDSVYRLQENEDAKKITDSGKIILLDKFAWIGAEAWGNLYKGDELSGVPNSQFQREVLKSKELSTFGNIHPDMDLVFNANYIVFS